MSFWALPPLPPTKLGRHRQLAPLAGIHVSPICLGAMSIGDKWGSIGMGEMDKDSSFKLLDAFYDAGGNFIDTANNYQDETSEIFLGEWMEKRGNRDQMVIATKVSSRPCACNWSNPARECSPTDAFVVHHQLQARRKSSPEDELHRQQHEVAPHLPRGVSQETAHHLRRHSLRPLGESRARTPCTGLLCLTYITPSGIGPAASKRS